MIVIMFDDLEPQLSATIRREQVFSAGRSLFHRGDAVRRVYFVITGMVHLVRHLRNGSPLVIQRAGTGAIVAEASLYSAKYHCDALAMSETTTWAVPKNVLLDRLARDPILATALAKRLASGLQHARFHAEMLSIKTVSSRLDAWLEWNETLPPRGEWARLAAQLGVSAEALYREMARRRASLS